MNILLLGSGGREHALAWALARELDPERDNLLVAPGNAGTLAVAENIQLDATDGRQVVECSRRNNIDLVMIGSELPLAAGVVDALTAAGIPAVGPAKSGARIETSKIWAKAFMNRHGIPTGSWQGFADQAAACAHVTKHWAADGLVIKADGLAAGKGVVVAHTPAVALDAIRFFTGEQTGKGAGQPVLIEERLRGTELSVMAFTDGNTYRLLPPARDHKALHDGDSGPNTGGMGAIAPVPGVSSSLLWQIEQAIIKPALQGLIAEGMPYRGVIYAGLMLTPAGPRVLEFNCRFGDPEAQVIVPGISNLLEILSAVAVGRLNDIAVEYDNRQRVCVVATAPGYPGTVKSGDVIAGLAEVALMAGVEIFHAGTCLDERQGFLTRHGRVLGVMAEGNDLPEARDVAYQAIDRISFSGARPYFRSDIGAMPGDKVTKGGLARVEA